jgi:hypothetical protein
VINSGPVKTTQVYIAEMSGLNSHPDHTRTMTVGWPCVEIAGATIGAVAVLQPLSFHAPILMCHLYLLSGIYRGGEHGPPTERFCVVAGTPLIPAVTY